MYKSEIFKKTKLQNINIIKCGVVRGFKKLWEINKELEIQKISYDNFDKNQKIKFDKFSNIYNDLRHIIIKEYNGQNVSIGFLKLYEILYEFDNEIFTKKKINTFHNAEMPGGFILCMNHYIKTMHKDIVWEWSANSYVSPNNFDDTYHLFKKNKEKWMMDEKCNGDITINDNIFYIAKKYLNVYGGCDIYTSDLGGEIYNNFNLQESMHFLPNLGQILLCFLILNKGGSCILKQFTFKNTTSQCLIYLLSQYFEQIQIIKPLTSKIGNSEIYILCTKFQGISNEIEIKKLFEILYLSKNDIYNGIELTFYKSFDKKFINFLNNASEIYNKQIYYFKNFNNLDLNKINEYKNEKYKIFFDRYKFSKLDIVNKIKCIDNIWSDQTKNKLKLSEDYSIDINFIKLNRQNNLENIKKCEYYKFIHKKHIIDSQNNYESQCIINSIKNIKINGIFHINFPAYNYLLMSKNNILVITEKYIHFNKDYLYLIDNFICFDENTSKKLKELYGVNCKILTIKEVNLNGYFNYGMISKNNKEHNFISDENDINLNIISQKNINIYLNDFTKMILMYYNINIKNIKNIDINKNEKIYIKSYNEQFIKKYYEKKNIEFIEY